MARGLLQNGATTPLSQQLNSTESFSEAIHGNNSITTEEEANETTNIEFRIESKYLHAGRCACFACSYSRDSLETDRESNAELNNTLSNADPTIAFGTLNELSDYLTTGFWEEAGTYTRRFNLGGSGLGAKNGQLTYNITGWADDSNGLSAERQNLTREVFKVYEAITGISFVEVATEGDFRFTDNDSGAYAYLGGGWYDQDPNTGTIDYNAAIIDYSVINVASSWFYGDSSYNSYTPQTIFHEIGHALGLGHQGQYNAGNGNPTYENSAQYGNDTWLTTMMSYWSQTTNTNVNASGAYLQTPMTVDWIALDKLYGSQGYGSFNAFNGNTVYGVGTNISSGTSEIMNNFATMISDTAYTLVDGSGYDILNVSNYSDDQFINLAPSELNGTLPSSSSIGGLVNNLTIGVGTILEEAIGGSGNDTFLGNIADNVFRGGSGGDRFYDSFGSDTYYGGSGSFDALYFSESYSDFSIENLGTSLAFSRNNSGLGDTDLIWNDIELVYFNDDVIKTYQELLADITPSNTPPTASNVFISTSEDSNSIYGNFNADDPDSNDVLTYTITTTPSIGLVSINSNGSFTYNFGDVFQSLGDGDSTDVVFQYIASDSSDTESDPATVTITINGSNDAPILSGTQATLGSSEFNSTVILTEEELLQGFSDPEGDTLSIVNLSASNGTVIDNNNGTWTYTPNNNFSGTISLTYEVIDSKGGSVTTNNSFDIKTATLAKDNDGNGIVDGSELSAYKIFSEDAAITIQNRNGQTYNDNSTINWDVVAAIETNTGFQVLLDGAVTYENQFYVWDTNADGVITQFSGWISAEDATSKGWEEIFNLDLNSDGLIGAPLADDDQNGIVDGSELSAYKIFSEDAAITIQNRNGQTYNDNSTINWDVVAAIETKTGFQVLLDGAVTYENQFYIWDTNADGVITQFSGWISAEDATSKGWEEIFNLDLNSDGLIGAPLADDDQNGIVDGSELSAYKIFSEDAAITIQNRNGQTYNDNSTINWDVVAAIETNTGFQVLLDGAVTYENQFYVWDTNADGVITQFSGWISAEDATSKGWEEIFNLDLNSDGLISPPTTLSSPTLEARFNDQWHLQGSSVGGANVASAWLLKNKSGNNIYGTGVHINIIDDGLDWRHQDLNQNYIATSSYDYVGGDNDPTPTDSRDDHGTAVAGVAAGYGHNGIGITGAAPNANISGQRLLGAGTARNEASALTRTMNAVDIYSNSWGPNDNGRLQAAPARVLAALKDGVTNGRDGKGAIYTWAGGNGRNSNDNSNYDGYANSRYVISVAAMTNRGRYSGYSEPGANVLVSAPSNGGTDAITTTSTNNSYIDNFGGTSSATPLVSGVIALMLEANPNLTWRDVQHVLVNSSDVVDAKSNGWFTNGAEHDFSHDYGFGRINAEAAVALAKTWNNVGDEVSYSASITPGIAIPDAGGGSISSTITISQDITLESVVIPILSDHTYAGDLTITLTSPEGTTAILSEGNRRDTSTLNFNFSAKTFWGESSRGVWTLTINDLASLDTGTLDQWGLNLYGTQGTNFNAATTDSITGNELETFTGASGMTYASKEALEQIEGLSSYLSHIEDLLAESPEKATGDWLIGTQGPQDQIMRASELGVSDSITSQTFNAQNGISSFSMISALDPTEFIAQSLDSLGTNLSYAYPELLHDTTTRSLIPFLETSTFKA
ncbi:S8 family serine peptidase [Synechococcus sp. A10-1-5-9]|uniref:S8 family serine peptidase n=1 Tax=Synechococcus sp. A10-1-5-9 TaxID=3392295 RepID=UPI0039EC751B